MGRNAYLGTRGSLLLGFDHLLEVRGGGLREVALGDEERNGLTMRIAASLVLDEVRRDGNSVVGRGGTDVEALGWISTIETLGDIRKQNRQKIKATDEVNLGTATLDGVDDIAGGGAEAAAISLEEDLLTGVNGGGGLGDEATLSEVRNEAIHDVR